MGPGGSAKPPLSGYLVPGVERSLRGDTSDLVRILGHHGDAGLEQVGEFEVVEADESDAALQAPALQDAHRCHRDDVLRGEDRRGRLGKVEEGFDVLLG